MYMCVCKGWKESDVRQAAREDGATIEQLTSRLGLLDEDCCGLCLLRLDEFAAVAELAVTPAELDRDEEPAA